MDWLRSLLTDKLVYSLVRKVMVLVSGWLLSLNVPAEIVTSFIDSGTVVLVAIILFLVQQLWSLAKRAKS